MEAVKDYLKNHLSELLQIHESYQIQWESRLDDAAALGRKENKNGRVCVDFQMMGPKLEIDDALAWKSRYANFSVTL